jgi:TusA-related sulfurtransferase
MKSTQMMAPQKAQSGLHFIDITDEICPMTFVKAKLMIEKVPQGGHLEVRLKGKEPLTNVPRSVLEHGHLILSMEPESVDQNELGVHLLLIEKT